MKFYDVKMKPRVVLPYFQAVIYKLNCFVIKTELMRNLIIEFILLKAYDFFLAYTLVSFMCYEDKINHVNNYLKSHPSCVCTKIAIILQKPIISHQITEEITLRGI